MVSNRQIASLSEKIGVCAKSADGRVLEQNAVCESICGPCLGTVCDKGCMILFRRSDIHPALNEGIQVFRGARLEGRHVDLAFIDDGSHITTLLYPLESKISKELAAFAYYGLSKRETEVISFMLRGFANQQLARTLSISIATLKTHLNHIYKKLPPRLGQDLRALKARGNDFSIESGRAR